MPYRAQLSVPDLRRSARHPVDSEVMAEHFEQGEMTLHLANVSTNGFMIDRSPGFSRGERLIIRLPEVGRIEGYCMWTTGDRAGFQFERIIRPDQFEKMIVALQPNRRLLRKGG
ncbi:PilZ domain-containing protein [Altericroceibacterium spongiae]|uniref:PilZ domain-containing protein n=1 Tax=Altericroceibacterium spongiae TaxID=2320269 RepID=A0A420ES93_9SPHN|nr:PilZ domain-containing protein [Altericroceibacterium spongiae]RKF23500.1 PilZ domain-containing protein [Altericroceibacterium spongiae]